MELDLAYPEIRDLRARAKQRVPGFVWEYLDSATGDESTHRLNQAALQAVRLRPRVLRSSKDPDLSTRIFGQTIAAPYGIAPVGMSGLIWPGAETMLARHAAGSALPYCLSTVAAETPETVGPALGGSGWFQLYPPNTPEVRQDLLRRARDAGFSALILTADVPVPSRRERQRRARLTNPMKMHPAVVLQAACRPAWALATLRQGIPKLATLEAYTTVSDSMPSTAHAGYIIRAIPDWEYLEALRSEWDGPLIVKGILSPDDAVRSRDAGADAIWVSNHGGRQLSTAPASIDCLAPVRSAVGPETPLIFDGGVTSGSDILRAIALGANLVMLGRAYHYGAAAFGAKGIDHVSHILREQMIADMGQLGIARPVEASDRLA